MSKTVDLAQISVPRLVFALLHQRFTGTVVIEQEPPHAGVRRMWFRGGMPVFTDWYEPTDLLGQILIAMGLLSDAELYPALERASAAKLPLGQILAREGRVDQEQLAEALRRQCIRKLTHVFSRRAGEVEVEAEAHTLGQDDGLIRLNVLELIATAVGALFDEERIAAEMGAALEAPVRATGALEKYIKHFRFRPSDDKVLNALMRGTDLVTLVTTEDVTRRRAVQILYTLWACQMLRVGAAAMDVPARPETPTREEPARAPAAAAPRRERSKTQSDVGGGPPSPVPRAGMVPPAPVAAAGSVAPPPARAGTSPGLDVGGGGEARPRSSTAPRLEPEKPTAVADVPVVRPRHDTMRDTSALGDDDSAAAPPASGDFMTALERVEGLIAAQVHPFALFGLALDAGKKEVRRAWGDLSRDFHPDALQSRGLGHLRERVNHVFAALSEAHQQLADQEAREALRKTIEAGAWGQKASDPSALARAAIEADVAAREGDKLLRAGAFDRAIERFRASAKLNPDEPEVMAAIAWCEYQLAGRPAGMSATVAARLADIITAAPQTARAYYFRGFLLVDLGHAALAIESFTKAHQLDRNLIDAERQARALRMARGTTTPSSEPERGLRSGLRGLFGKK